MPVHFTRPQDWAREVIMVDSIWIVLSFQTEPTMASIRSPVFARKRFWQVVSSVELNTRLVAIHFDVTACRWVVHSSNEIQVLGIKCFITRSNDSRIFFIVHQWQANFCLCKCVRVCKVRYAQREYYKYRTFCAKWQENLSVKHVVLCILISRGKCVF